MILCDVPEKGRVGNKGLASKDHTVRILPAVFFIPPDAVIVAGHIHGRKAAAGLHVGPVKGRTELHKGIAQGRRQLVVECASHFLVGLGVRFFVTVDAHAHGIQEIEEDVDAAGNLSGGIHQMQIIRHGTGKLDSLCLAGLRHLVSGGIQDHAGMIVIADRHGAKVDLIILHDAGRIVVLGLVNIPAVRKFVHQKHAEPVAGLQRCLRAGVVGAADGVIAGFLHQADLSLFGVRIRAGAQNSVVMMNAGAAQKRPLSVDPESVSAVDGQLADSEHHALAVLAKMCLQCIKIRMITAPEVCTLKGHDRLAVRPLKLCLDPDIGVRSKYIGRTNLAGHHLCLAEGFGAVNDLQTYRTGNIGPDLDLDDPVAGVDRCHADSVQKNMLCRKNMHGNRPVDTGTRIPAAVGLAAVECRYLKNIAAAVHIRRCVHVKAGTSILGAAGFMTIDGYGAFAVNAFKFQNRLLTLIDLRNGKVLLVKIIQSLVPPDIFAASGGTDPFFRDHGVMGDRHMLRRVFAAQRFYSPVLTKIKLHPISPSRQITSQVQAYNLQGPDLPSGFPDTPDWKC